MTQQSIGRFMDYQFILTDRRSVLKFPSGKKDGNRLGKRKRRLTIMIAIPSYQKDSEVMVDKVRKIIFCTSKQYDAIQAKVKP